MATNYLGSTDLETSVADQEIIPHVPETWTVNYGFYKFSFYNDQDCHIKINGSDNPIFLRAGQGFNMNLNDGDRKITSFKIVENGITFNWIGAYGR